MMRETWYVLEDGAVADPAEVKRDAAGVLRHRDGIAVAMRGDVPRSRGINVDAQAKAMAPAAGRKPYGTRVMQAGLPLDRDDDGRPGGAAPPAAECDDLAATRAEYQTKFGKRAFAGWDAATLREKIAAAE